MKTINIYSFFPLKDPAMLEAFLKKDEDFDERKRQFYQVLIPSIQTDDKKKFASSILNAVFSHEYWMTHRWPTIQ